MITAKKLEEKGLVINNNMWLGNGFLYCGFCKQYTHHYAMSHKEQADCFEICRKCNQYSGRYEL